MVIETEDELQQQQQQPQRLKAVLTSPFSLEGGLAAEHRMPNMVQRVLSLFGSIRPGADLTHFQLPPLFNLPKSQLQCYGEAVYCTNENILSRCANGGSSLERFASVVAWCVSTTRPLMFGFAPFNPVLGETHHVSCGTLNVLLEQVSHHPPVSALHATDAEEKVELLCCQYPVPKFHGTSVEAVIHGERKLKLLGHDEVYEMNSPNLIIRLLPVPSTEWSGKVTIHCKESGLEAELCHYRSGSFLGIGGNSRSVKGAIFYSKSRKKIYDIEGQWDRCASSSFFKASVQLQLHGMLFSHGRTLVMKDIHSGKTSILYDAKQAISLLKTPAVEDPNGLSPTESAVVWGEVSEGILTRDWEKAREAKRAVEERERKLARERKSNGEIWIPKHFTVSQTKEGQWECCPKDPYVPPAPITV